MAVSDVVISFFELLEAEGRALGRFAARFFFGVVLFAAAGVFVIIGGALLVAAFCSFLMPVLGMTMSLLAAGALALLLAIGIFMFGFRFADDNEREEASGDYGEQGTDDSGGEGKPKSGDGAAAPPSDD
jgi:membrane protein implicated in regulation of membrane protease activity